jgi:AraC family transcriptional regulator of adaptative response/methylated-DNA-[protein]-cysteine methyltransferase
MDRIDVTYIDTELGRMVAAATAHGVCLLAYEEGRHLALEMRQLSRALAAPLVEGDNPHLAALRRQVGEYFAGERREFDIPLCPVGTEFQKKVWDALRGIPYGSTVSYAQQAAAMGCPEAVRAVAGANGKNKISIILPCHRVIGSDGSLTGYGGGVWRKKRLLELEGAATIRTAEAAAAPETT